MAKVEPRIIQKEAEAGKFHPLYWMAGPERMKSRELIRLIQKHYFGEKGPAFPDLQIRRLDGRGLSGHDIVQEAQSLVLGGGSQLIWVDSAHELKDEEALLQLCGPLAPRSEMPSLVIAVSSQKLDLRTKWTKSLVEGAAVVICDEVADNERERWLHYLASQKKLILSAAEKSLLLSLDPWSLDRIDRELEVLSLLPPQDRQSTVSTSYSAPANTQEWVDAFFLKDRKRLMAGVVSLGESPETALPLLGLLSWQTQTLATWLSATTKSERLALKYSDFVIQKLERFAPHWTPQGLAGLAHHLFELDYGFKQTRAEPLALWADLALRITAANPTAEPLP